MNEKFNEKDLICLEKHIGDMVTCNVITIGNNTIKSYQGYLYDTQDDCIMIGENIFYCNNGISCVSDIYSLAISEEIYKKEPAKTLKKELK